MVLACSTISRRCGSGHKCTAKETQRRGSTNRARIYSTRNEDDMSILYCVLCKKKNLPLTNRCVPRSAMEELEKEFGDHEFMMCRNFANILKKNMKGAPAPSRQLTLATQEPVIDPPSPFVLDESDSELEEEVCNILHNAQVTPTSDLQSNDSATGPSPSSVLRRMLPRRLANQSSRMDSENLRPTSIVFETKKRKSSKDLFLSTFSSIHHMKHKDIKFWKEGCLLSKQSYKRRIDEALCHLLSISGFKESDVKTIHNNAEIFNDVTQLLTSIKAKLVKKIVLTASVANEMDTQNERTVEESEESIAARALGESVAEAGADNSNKEEATKEDFRRKC